MRTKTEYNRAIGIMDEIVDEVGNYKSKSFPIPDAAPHKVLAFLIEAHGLKKSDIPGVPQIMVSAILSGKRAISKDTAKTLAARFNISPAMFL